PTSLSTYRPQPKPAPFPYTTLFRSDDGGKEQTINERLSLPADIANGLLFTLVRHIQPSVLQTIVSHVAMTPKPRVVELLIFPQGDRKSTRLNSSHVSISYAAFCLKK